MKENNRNLVVKDETTTTGGEVVINLPAYDTDITLRLPNGKLIAIQFRVEQPSIDFILPENCAVNCWKGDDMEPAGAMRRKPGQGSQAHVRFAKQLAIPLHHSVLDEESARGWVFCDEESDEEIGFAEPGEYPNAEIAVDKFGREHGEDFSVYFRDAKGEMHAVADESKPDDFD